MPAGAAAAGAAIRRRKKLLAKKERLIKAESERKAARQAKCDELFAVADKDRSSTLDAKEARTLVQSLLGATELTDHIYLQVVAYATGKYPSSLTTSISKSEFPALVTVAEAYTEQMAILVPLFDKYDVDRSDTLDVKELVSALIEVSPKGMLVEAGDILWLLAKCDMDGDHALSREELLPALAQWRELVRVLPPPDAANADDAADDGTVDAVVASVMDGLRLGAYGDDVEAVEAVAVEAVEADNIHDNIPSSSVPVVTAGVVGVVGATAPLEVVDPIEKRLAERVHRLDGSVILQRGNGRATNPKQPTPGMYEKILVRTLSGKQVICRGEEWNKFTKAGEQRRAKQRAEEKAARTGAEPPKPSSSCAIL